VNGGRVCGGAAVTTALCRVTLLGIVLVLIVIAYFPFAWSPPRNQVTRTADGSLRFGQLNYARTSGTPAWLNDVRTSGRIRIQLEASPQSLRQNAPMMIMASDYWDTDFAIGQDHSDLMIWLRRPRSDPNGDPPFVIRGVFEPQRWTSVDLILLRGDLRIDVDGRTRLTEHLPADSLQAWGKGRIALGDEVEGSGPWQGQIRLARVRSAGYSVDYVRPGALSIPVSYLYIPSHIESFPPHDLRTWLTIFFHMLSFIPVGFLIVFARRPPWQLGSSSSTADTRRWPTLLRSRLQGCSGQRWPGRAARAARHNACGAERELDGRRVEQRTQTLNERFATAAGQIGSDKPPGVRAAAS
jgi:hypothetical protein